MLLDEPENGLSLVNQLALGRLIIDWVRAGSQVVMATHSVVLLGIPGAVLMDFDDGGLALIEPSRTTHWTIARRVITDPEFFRKVVDDE